MVSQQVKGTQLGSARGSRRMLLTAGVMAGSAAAVGATSLPAHADGRRSKRFDLHGDFHQVFVPNRMLHESHHAMQSVAFDDLHDRVYIAQLQNGTDGDDLCVNQLDRNGTLTGWMRIPDAGHGVSFAVEPHRTRTFLWTEADSSEHSTSGRGTALQRFEFRSGEEPQDARKYWQGSNNVTCAIDPVQQRLVVRRHEGRMTFYVYHLADAARGDFGTPLRRMVLPEGITGTGQGYTMHGDYLYYWQGDGHIDPTDIDSTIWVIDMISGTIVDKHLITVAPGLMFREPEGIAVHRGRHGRPELCVGFASRNGQDRYASVYGLDRMRPGRSR